MSELSVPNEPLERLPASQVDVRKWLRDKKKFPHMWCPGCGLGIILGASLRAFEALDYDRNDLVLVSGIGCTGRIPAYVDCNTLHTTHGRALTFATGIKMAKPHLKVVVFMGDGDALAIGGNHFIHSCRRNIDITAIVVNNSIYGMTGGQVSPTTPHMMNSTTTPFGQFALAFDPCDLAIGAGATYVARSTAAHAKHMQKMIEGGLRHPGFSVIEIVANCPTCYGRLNKLGGPVEMLKNFRDTTVRYKKGMDVAEAKAGGQCVIGLLHHDNTLPEFITQKNSVVENGIKATTPKEKP